MNNNHSNKYKINIIVAFLLNLIIMVLDLNTVAFYQTKIVLKKFSKISM